MGRIGKCIRNSLSSRLLECVGERARPRVENKFFFFARAHGRRKIDMSIRHSDDFTQVFPLSIGRKTITHTFHSRLISPGSWKFIPGFPSESSELELIEVLFSRSKCPIGALAGPWKTMSSIKMVETWSESEEKLWKFFFWRKKKKAQPTT